MGRKSARARRRQQQKLNRVVDCSAVNSPMQHSVELYNKTDGCEPFVESFTLSAASSVPKPSRIPVMKNRDSIKSLNVSTATAGDLSILSSFSDTKKSKIPRPVNVYYAPRSTASSRSTFSDASSCISNSESLISVTGQLASYPTCDMKTGTESGLTCRDWVSPIKKCSLSTEFDSVTGFDENELKVVAESHGVEIELNLRAMMAGSELEISGIKIA